MAVIAFNEELNSWAPGSHTGTFRGNQIAFATGLASLQYMREEKLWETVAAKGEAMLSRLNTLAIDHKQIGDVRGRGLMLGVEFVQPGNHDARGVPKPDGMLAATVQVECFKRKLILERGGRDGAVMRFLPPLTTSEKDLQAMFAIFSDAVAATCKGTSKN